MAAEPQVRASRGNKVTELFANESVGSPLARNGRGDQMIIKSPSQKNHLAAGTELFVAFGEEGDRGGVGLGGIGIVGGDHAVLVAH